jgi:hypothetical protein
MRQKESAYTTRSSKKTTSYLSSELERDGSVRLPFLPQIGSFYVLTNLWKSSAFHDHGNHSLLTIKISDDYHYHNYDRR